MRSVPEPSIRLKAFACPHCGAMADQSWYDARVQRNPSADKLPRLPDPDFAERAVREAKAAEMKGDEDAAKGLRHAAEWAKRMLEGGPFLHSERYVNADLKLENVFVSACRSCGRLSIWIHDRLVFPGSLAGPAPSPDLPPDLAEDFEEARRVVDLSPRGAAALLRLLVQKLCKHLGEPGDNINADIGSLVRKGLDSSVQQALDAVRVIGNEAVHPGQMDLQDDRDTALLLFELVNDIVAQMISRPNRAREIYAKLPQAKRDAIAKRDGGSGP